jgi:predicted RNA-binding Zn ribbon-like protein
MNTQEGVTPQLVEVHTLEEVTEMFRTLMNVVATKDDLNQFATKKDLDRFATKEDLKQFATKEDLEQIRSEMVTKIDLKQAIVEVTYELKDHVTREILKMRDIAYIQNEKTNEFVRTVQKSGTISRPDAIRLTAINPFA